MLNHYEFCSFVSQLSEMTSELYSGGTHRRRYGLNKHTIEPSPESFQLLHRALGALR